MLVAWSSVGTVGKDYLAESIGHRLSCSILPSVWRNGSTAGVTGVSDATERARPDSRVTAAALLNMHETADGERFLRLARWTLECLRDDLDALVAELEAEKDRTRNYKLLSEQRLAKCRRLESLSRSEREKHLLDRAVAAEKRVAELEAAIKKALDLRGSDSGYPLIGNIQARQVLRDAPGPCLNCGSREQTVVCADCGRINPAEETP